MTRFFLLSAVLLFLTITSFAQTPGLIFKSAGAGAAVLDPNGDGYTSATRAGFSGNDQVQSEIAYKPIPVPSVEPTMDPGPGPDCGFTDFVDSGSEDPELTYFDGTNLLFRLRLGNTAPNSKGYSILVDTDQKFGFTGPNADPNAVTGNAGFELEISLQTNFGVRLYSVDGTASPVLKASYSFADYVQYSIAYTTNCGNPDYFYDFFIPFSSITTNFPGVTTSTPLRMLAITAMNPNPAIGNSALSDVGGIDDAAYGYNYDNIFKNVIENFYPTPVTGINSGLPQDRTSCPAITSSLTVSSTSISGTSTEPSGTTIRIFKNNVLAGTGTTSGTSWTVNGLTGLVAGDVFTASAQATSKTESVLNCTSIIVATTCSENVTINLTNTNTKNIGGSAVVGAAIKVYQNGSLISPNPVTSATVDVTGTFCWKTNGNTGSCNGGTVSLAGGYKVTQTESGKCESSGVYVCISGIQSTVPVITSTSLTPSSVTVSGTSVSGAIIELYADGVSIGSGVAIGTSWSVTGLKLVSGKSITAKAIAGTECLSNASNSVVVASAPLSPSVSPVITGTYCTSTSVSSISGYSTEATGTLIQLYSGATLLGSGNTISTGTWTITGLSILPGTTVTARATAAGESQSLSSNSVTIQSVTSNSGLNVNGPLVEGQATITGTVSGSGTVKVYADGSYLGIATVSGGTWTFTPTTPAYEVYAGGQIAATLTVSGSCESNLSAGVSVQCITPLANLTVTPSTPSLCTGSSAQVVIAGSEGGIVYQLYSGIVSTGSSVLGNGVNITLTSATLTASTTLSVKAIKISPVTCSSTLTGTVVVAVNPLITGNTITAPAITSFCGQGNAAVFTGSTPTGGNGNYIYQWQSSSNNILFTDITGATEKDYDPAMVTQTIYFRRVSTSGGCMSTSNTTSITVQATDLTNVITAPAVTAFCNSGDPAILNGTVPTGGTGSYTYQWQSSSDEITFTNVTGTLQNFDPPSTSSTLYYRRLVSSGTCTSYASNAVMISIASAITTTITSATSSIIANGTSTASITIQLRDNAGNNLDSAPCIPVLTTSSGTLSSLTSAGNGRFTAVLTSSTNAGTAVISGTLGSTAITDTESVSFVTNGIPSVSLSMITSSFGSITANGTSTSIITIQLKDQYGNNLTAGGAALTLATTAGTLSSVADNGNGTYTASLTSSTTTGTATISALIAGISIADTEVVSFIPGTAVAGNSLITATSNSIVANGISTVQLTVQLKDANGNNLTSGGSTVVLSATSGTISTVNDNGNGTYTATLTSAVTTGTSVISGTFTGSPITDTESVTFVPGPLAATKSIITAASNSITANGTSSTIITLQLKDANNNNLLNGGDVVTLSATLGTLSAVTDNSNGTYTAILTSSTNTGTSVISGTVSSNTLTDTESVNFTAGSPSATTSTITVSPSSIIADGVSTTQVIVQVKDSNGNTVTTGGATVIVSASAGNISMVTDGGNGTYSAILTSSTTTGISIISGKLNTVSITDTESVEFTPGPASLLTSVITALSSSITANGTSSTMIKIQLKDVNGNLVITGGAAITLTTTIGTLSAVTDHGDGTYTATLTSTTSTGSAIISGKISTASITDTETVFFTSGNANASKSTITAAASSISANGSSSTQITVQLKDANDNLLSIGGSPVMLTTSLGTISSVTDNNNGTYTATLTSSSSAGTALITGTVGGVAITDSESVSFVAGTASVSNSTITVANNALTANGISNTEILVQLKDSNGNNLSSGGAVVTLATTLGTIGTITDNNNGTYTATLTSSTTSGAATITGKIGGFNMTDSETVQFTPGNASLLNSLITSSASSVTANGTSTVSIKIRLIDSHGNNITTGGAVITLSTTLGTISSVTDNGDGTYSATLTSSTTAGTAIITGKIGTGSIVDTESVSFLPGLFNAGKTLLSTTENSLVANGTSFTVITVQAKDVNNNNLTSGGAVVTLSSTAGTLSSVLDNNNGTYTATLTSSTTAGISLVTGTIGGALITDSETIAFIPGAGSATASQISAANNSIVADGVTTTQITLQLRDSNGNAILTGGTAVALSTTSGTLSNVTDNGNGSYSAILTSTTTTGSAIISGKISGISVTDTETVQFVNGPVSASTSLISAASLNLVANGITTTTITVILKDAKNNSLTSGGSTVALTTSLGTLSSVTDTGNGTYTAVLTSSLTTGEATITGTVDGSSITDSESVMFFPASADVKKSIITAVDDVLVADGETKTTITIQLKDANGNNLATGGANVQLSATSGTLSAVKDNGDGTYTVTLTSSVTKGSAVISATLNGTLLTDTEIISFIPGQAVAERSLIVASKTEVVADGVSTSIITVTLKDVNGNLLEKGGENVDLSASLGTLSVVTDHGNGTYTSILTSPTLTGSSIVEGNLNGIAITENAAVIFIPGMANAGNSLITIEDESLLADGMAQTLITIQLRDAFGNVINIGGEEISLTSTLGTLSVVSDNNNGIYTATLTASTTAGIAVITGSLNGEKVDKDLNVAFLPDIPSAEKSTMSSTESNITANGVSTTVIIIRLFDANGNPQTSGGDDVNFVTSEGLLSGVTDHGDGTYSVILTSPLKTGIAKVTATINGDDLADHEFVVFIPGSPSVEKTTLTVNPGKIIADGISTSVVTVTVLDENENLVTMGGLNIALITTAGTLSEVEDLDNGNYRAVLTSGTKVETALITGTLTGKAIHDNASVNFVTDAADATKSTLIAGAVQLVADGVTTTRITIQLKDSKGNNITSGGDAVTITSDKGIISQVIDNGDGTYTAIFTSPVSVGTATMTASVNGTSLPDLVIIDLIPGVASVIHSQVVATPLTIPADGLSASMITIVLKDAHGNPLTEGGNTVTLLATAGTLSTVTDLGNGSYTATLTSAETAEQSVITAFLEGNLVADNASVEFTAVPVIVFTTISADKTSVPADGISTITVTITLRDDKNRPVINSVVSAETTAGTLTAVIHNGDGTYTFILTAPEEAGSALVSFEVNGVADPKSIAVSFTSGSLFIPEGFSPDGDGTNDTFIILGAESYRISMKVFNRWGNVVYQSDSYKNDWDGSASNGVVIGDKLPDGTYFYAIDFNNGEKPLVRYLTIKRK